jgi:hypothetical protein
MGLRQLCKLFTGVRSSHPPPIIVDYSDVAQPAEQFLHTEKVGGSVPSVTTKLWVFSKMNITQRYER